MVLESGKGRGVDVRRGEFKCIRRWWWDREEVHLKEGMRGWSGGWEGGVVG